MTDAASQAAYNARISTELDFYAEPEAVADLPPIYSIWAQRYCLPLIHDVGFAGLPEFFDHHVAEQCRRLAPAPARMVSLGAGSAETEFGIAERLRDQGIENLQLVLLELNQQLLDRALTDATRRGLGDRVVGIQTDLNTWCTTEVTDIYFANHSLHHLVALEHLFGEIRTSLDKDGVLLINDMIGRNGHVRWPEAVDLVKRIWSVMPARYRWNNFEHREDEIYPDLDCSEFAFEGIRAQDILPLLLERFHPDVYITFLNVADPFIDRIYGPNFDVGNPEDLAFIDALGFLDDAAIDLQLVTPTHLVASFRNKPVACRFPRQRSPQRTVRTARTHDEPPSVEPVPSSEEAVDLAELTRDREEAWGRFNALRQRKVVRAALLLAALRARALGRLRQGRA